MIPVSTENFAILQSDAAEKAVQVILVALDGAHSSGKTTAVDSIIEDNQLLAHPDFEFGPTIATQSGQRYHQYCISRTIEGVEVPIVVTSEQATLYDARHPGENVLTDGFNQHDQAAITFRAHLGIHEAAMAAAGMAALMQPDREAKIALLVTDRSSLAGFAYADVRLPDIDHSYVDVEIMAAHDGLMLTSNNNIAPIPLRAWTSEFMKYCDVVFIPNHTEVPLIDNGIRVMDDQFRDLIAGTIKRMYIDTIGADKVHDLRGNKRQRLDLFNQYLGELLRAQIIKS